ncbi:hypothetical protein E2C01_098926 [Portunus trituberculatus]|uniref:Uncharacterized protein n=1 Tax=Portunus trituberculatus TaxID=210409 RepID=A0A5B7K9N3_PORTR|nr:hypothetical protein [Portunus trituberculatus]
MYSERHILPSRTSRHFKPNPSDVTCSCSWRHCGRGACQRPRRCIPRLPAPREVEFNPTPHLPPICHPTPPHPSRLIRVSRRQTIGKRAWLYECRVASCSVPSWVD